MDPAAGDSEKKDLRLPRASGDGPVHWQHTDGASPPLTPPSAAASASALAVFACLQAWRDQLMPDDPPPEFDPDEPRSDGAAVRDPKADGPSRGHLHLVS